MASVGVRYIVDDVDAAIEFYCGALGFQEVMRPAPPFAMLSDGSSALIATRGDRAVGVVTKLDVLEYLAHRRARQA